MKKDTALESKVRKERIAIVDSLASCRIGISHHIKKLDLWEVAWSSSTAEEAMEKMALDEPDLLIVEIQLVGKDGLEFIKSLIPFYPNLRILVHSSHSEEFYAERCLRAGALGYLNKAEPMAKFEHAVKKVLKGEMYLTERIAQQTLHSVLKHVGNDENHHLHDLTDRELEVMILMAHGHSCHDSAEKLHISPRTVQVHRNNIRLKIGLESALQLHAYAVRFYGEGVSGGELHHPPENAPTNSSDEVKSTKPDKGTAKKDPSEPFKRQKNGRTISNKSVGKR